MLQGCRLDWEHAAGHGQVERRNVCVPEGRGGGGGDRSVLVLLGAVGTELGESLIPYSLDSLESVLGKEDPREVLGESVFKVLEL